VPVITINFSEPHIQSLMDDHVFKNYLKFDEHCNINNKSISLEECGDCHYKSYLPNGNPKYNCDNFKRCYLIRYLSRQFEQNDFLIKTYISPDIKSRTTLSAVSLGGGPAPEALALMEWLDSSEIEHNLYFANIELEASWESIYRDICCQFSNYINNFKLKLGFIHGDANSYISNKQYDIVFISWLFSEMRGQNIGDILQVANNLVKPQGYMLIMDYHKRSLVEEISNLINITQDLTLLNHESKHKVHSIVNFSIEIKKTFGPHIDYEFAYWVIQRSLDDIPF